VNTATHVKVAKGNDQERLSLAAHWHADRGLYVFPVVPGRKTPAVEDWEHQATTDHLTIARIWRQAPYNIGVATGPSGLLVVDLDLPKNPTDLPPDVWCSRGARTGGDVLALAAADAGNELPADTYAVETPSGGRHLYFRQPGEPQLRNSAGRIGWKIDTRGHGGYVVGADSLTEQGRYRTTDPTPPQPLPAWITATLDTSRDEQDTAQAAATVRDSTAYALAALTRELDKVLAATEGQRNDTLNTAAFALGQLVGVELLDQALVRAELVSAAGRIGLSPAEGERTITSGLTAGARQPRRRPA
jgi:hypothetical protein